MSGSKLEFVDLIVFEVFDPVVVALKVGFVLLSDAAESLSVILACVVGFHVSNSILIEEFIDCVQLEIVLFHEIFTLLCFKVI